MAERPHGSRCAWCGGPIEVKKAAGGRPRIYCDVQCRRRAKRERDRTRRDLAASWRPVAHDLVTNSLQLYSGRNLNLQQVMALAKRVAEDADCLAGVAAQTALQRGATWERIAHDAELSLGVVTAKWGGTRVSDQLAARNAVLAVPEFSHADDSSAASPSIAGPRIRGIRRSDACRHLATALRTLHLRHGVSLPEAAAATRIPLVIIRDMVTGRTVEPWATTYAVAHALHGEPQDLLQLWELASGSRPALHVGVTPLAPALRGAWLAAGSPSVTDAYGDGGSALLGGQAVPPWPQVAELLRNLGADPKPYEPLWVEARAAQLKTDGRAGPL